MIKPTVLVAILLCMRVASAASIAVDPVRIELSAETRSATISVKNTGNEPVVVQAEVLAWSQEDGRDTYMRTRDVLVTPTVTTVPPRSDQIVRIALRTAPDAKLERAFRLYVQEVPAAAKPGALGLSVALRIGIPVFVAPAEGRAAARLAWRVAADALTARNEGTGNARLSGLTLVDAAGQTVASLPDLAYVLPGRSRSWVLPTVPAPGGTLRLRAEGHAGTIDEPVPVR